MLSHCNIVSSTSDYKTNIKGFTIKAKALNNITIRQRQNKGVVQHHVHYVKSKNIVNEFPRNRQN